MTQPGIDQQAVPSSAFLIEGTEDIPNAAAEPLVVSERRRWSLNRPQQITVFVIACALFGALLGCVWHLFVKLPVYTIQSDGSAVTDERGLTQFIATDAVYSLIGLVAGIAIGVVAWRAFGRWGWQVVAWALCASGAAALTCWVVGIAIGPTDFADRITTAQPGDIVSIDFMLRSPSAPVVWLFAAIAPILLLSALAKDELPDTAREASVLHGNEDGLEHAGEVGRRESDLEPATSPRHEAGLSGF